MVIVWKCKYIGTHRTTPTPTPTCVCCYLRHRRHRDNTAMGKKYRRISPVNMNSADFHPVMSVAPPGGSTLAKPRTKDTAVSSWYARSLQPLERRLCKRLTFCPIILLFIPPRFLQERVCGEGHYFSTPLMGLSFPEAFPLLLVVGGASKSDPNRQIKSKINPLYGKALISASSNHRYREYLSVTQWVNLWDSEWVISVIQWVN